MKVPCSGDTISCKISDMSNDIELNMKEKLSVSKIFSFQVDELCDISRPAQLIAYIRYIESESKNQFLLQKSSRQNNQRRHLLCDRSSQKII